MRCNYQNTNISTINLADTSFRISESDASPGLINSIASLGLLNPPTLIAKDDSYTIISGFARVDACLKLGVREINARVIEPDTPLKVCVQLAILEKAFESDLNTLEQANIVKMLVQVCDGVEELVSVAKHLGLSLNQKMAEKLNLVHQMPDGLKAGLSSGAIALPVALQIQNIKERDALDRLCQLFNELNLSLNRQRAMLESLLGISKRENIGFKQILAEKPLQSILQDTQLDRRQKASQIGHYLKQRRLPHISSFEIIYNNLIGELNPKKGVRIVPPANLESPTYAIQIEFKNLVELKAMDQEIQRIVASPYMERILDQLNKKFERPIRMAPE